MFNVLSINPKVLCAIIEKVHDDNLPVTIDAGTVNEGEIKALFEYPDSFNESFYSLLNDTSNEVLDPSEFIYYNQNNNE